jgi:hypothetical protein
VPAGAALAGALLPAAARRRMARAFLGWRRSGCSSRLRRSRRATRLDLRNPARKVLSRRRDPAPLRSILRTPTSLELSLIGIRLRRRQDCLSSFLVVYLTDDARVVARAAG